MAINPHIGFILLTLIEDRLGNRKLNKETRNDLSVIQSMLMNTLDCEHTFYDSEEP